MSHEIKSEEEPMVRFYKPDEKPFGVFCNYLVSPISIRGKYYNSVEHFYQSKKFIGDYEETVRSAKTPHQSKVLASLRVSASSAQAYEWRVPLDQIIAKALEQKVQVRSDWEDIKEDIMFEGLKAKFDAYPTYKKLLLSTGTQRIEENSPIDTYWGTGKYGTGKNRLGVLLMKLREEYTKGDSPNANAIHPFFQKRGQKRSRGELSGSGIQC